MLLCLLDQWMLLGGKRGFLILCIVTSVFVTMPTSVVEKSWLRLCKLGFLFGWLLYFFFPNSLLPLPCLAPLANTFIRLCNVHCCRQSSDFVLNIGGERKKWSYLCVIRFHEKLVHPCCKLPVRATGLPPWKRSRNVLVLIPQYLLVHVVLDIMCEAGV